jgi:predicted NAD/FAD-binding protein
MIALASQKKRICVVGGGISGLSAAWALSRHPDRFDVLLYEKNDYLGGNAVTVDIPQDDGSSIPVDISVTAYIPTVYQNYMQMLSRFGIGSVPTRFSYSVSYGKDTYAHDFDSPLKQSMQPEIDRFQRLLRFIKKINFLNKQPSMLLAALNPFNYVRMGFLLDLFGFSAAFKFKILKPMFVNFLLATNVFDMPAAMFCMYLDFFDIEKATPMVTWDQGTRNLYSHMAAEFADRVCLRRGVERIRRTPQGVFVLDSQGNEERFDEVVLACNANQALMMLDRPGALERWTLSHVRYESELHNHAYVHTDGSVLPDNETRPLDTRSNYILQYGGRPDNYEITYIMHNQQPWAKRSDKPCLVTYNPIQPIDEKKIVKRLWFQHVIHDVFHSTVLLRLFSLLQGRRRTWYCGAHTIVNSQEHCLISGLAVARQLGADYPFQNVEARKWFNYYGGMVIGTGFRKA